MRMTSPHPSLKSALLQKLCLSCNILAGQILSFSSSVAACPPSHFPLIRNTFAPGKLSPALSLIHSRLPSYQDQSSILIERKQGFSAHVSYRCISILISLGLARYCWSAKATFSSSISPVYLGRHLVSSLIKLTSFRLLCSCSHFLLTARCNGWQTHCPCKRGGRHWLVSCIHTGPSNVTGAWLCANWQLNGC